MAKRKQAQKEFEGMPERSDLGKKAIEYINQIDQIEKVKNIIENTRIELIKLFKKEKKERITIEGRTVSYAHVEADKISIRQKLDKQSREDAA
jgi:transcription initiation factor TFIIIB Brf1 subunit/transcription initiation factor TFIIB